MGGMEQTTYIRRVRIDNLHFVPQLDQHRAVVVVVTDEFTMCLVARRAGGAGDRRADIRNGLLEDAMRQMRQLPEYRTGRCKIVLALRPAGEIGRAA